MICWFYVVFRGVRCVVVQVQGGGVDDCVGDRGQVRIVIDGGGSSLDQRTLRVVGGVFKVFHHGQQRGSVGAVRGGQYEWCIGKLLQVVGVDVGVFVDWQSFLEVS